MLNLDHFKEWISWFWPNLIRAKSNVWSKSHFHIWPKFHFWSKPHFQNIFFWKMCCTTFQMWDHSGDYPFSQKTAFLGAIFAPYTQTVNDLWRSTRYLLHRAGEGFFWSIIKLNCFLWVSSVANFIGGRKCIFQLNGLMPMKRRISPNWK